VYIGQPPTRNGTGGGISDDFSDTKYREFVDSLPRQRKTSREVPEVPSRLFEVNVSHYEKLKNCSWFPSQLVAGRSLLWGICESPINM